jgi:hypothetical protein
MWLRGRTGIDRDPAVMIDINGATPSTVVVAVIGFPG